MNDLKGWISVNDRLPEKMYTIPFLLIVRNEDEHMHSLFPYHVMIGQWSNFGDRGKTFDCWKKSCINDRDILVANPIPIERILYWRPIPEVPDNIKGKIWL